MMHYKKGENVEKEITKDDLPFNDCLPQEKRNFLWMQVKGGTKVNNVMTYAKTALEKGLHRSVVWSGSGGGVVKTVSCAEILKRNFPLFQLTRMCYTTIEEHWLPQTDGLEEIIVSRKIPCIHILMSLDPIDVSGIQKPNTTTDFWMNPKKDGSKQSRGGVPQRPMGQNEIYRFNQQEKQEEQEELLQKEFAKEKRRPKRQQNRQEKKSKEAAKGEQDKPKKSHRSPEEKPQSSKATRKSIATMTGQSLEE